MQKKVYLVREKTLCEKVTSVSENVSEHYRGREDCGHFTLGDMHAGLWCERLKDQEGQESLPSTGLRDSKGICPPQTPQCSRKGEVSVLLPWTQEVYGLNIQIREVSPQCKLPGPGATSPCSEASPCSGFVSPPGLGLCPVNQAQANIWLLISHHIYEQEHLTWRLIWDAKNKWHSHASGLCKARISLTIFHIGLALLSTLQSSLTESNIEKYH